MWLLKWLSGNLSSDMILDDYSRRRALAGLTSLALGTSCGAGGTPSGPWNAGSRQSKGIIAFDAFPIFDPRPVGERVARYLGSSSRSFMETWRARQFEYTWWLASAGRYLDFWEVTLRALRFAHARSEVRLAPQVLTEIAETYLHLPIWPDVVEALDRLERVGYRLALLSNFTPKMLKSCLASAGLDKSTVVQLSADSVKSYKPSPTVYRLVMDHFQVSKDQVTFVAFAPWDALGASWFGYETVWVNRASFASEELEPILPQMDSLTSLADLLCSA